MQMLLKATIPAIAVELTSSLSTLTITNAPLSFYSFAASVYLQQINTYDADRIIVVGATDTTNSYVSHLPPGWVGLRCLLNHVPPLTLTLTPGHPDTCNSCPICHPPRPLPLSVRRIWKPNVFAWRTSVLPRRTLVYWWREADWGIMVKELYEIWELLLMYGI